VKFLLNMNLPPELGRKLAEAGHDWRHAVELGMARACDAEILAVAKDEGETVLTHDLDYGQLLAFSGDSSPSVVIFRLRRVGTGLLSRRLLDSWGEIEEVLEAGAIVIVEAAATRIRRLPFVRV
jgi:predicted nuclease of predicted toxin-antitoxin system